jgi:ABC-type Fe3+/spermidine/putrescine transport system ATPase subunit
MPPQSQGKSALSLENIEHSFRGKFVLTGINIQAYRGDIVCVLGPSGCGKTTLLRIIAGLLDPTHGTVWIDGLEQKGVAPHKRNLGFVFQQPILFPTMDVYRNIAFPFTKGGKPVPRGFANWSEAVDQVLRQTGLSGLERQSTSNLSGGQKQRVALARTLVYQPTLLLLDEPLSSVDNSLREELIQLLLELHERVETTMLYVTHNEREAQELATHLAVINSRGRLLRYDTVGGVINSPKYVTVASLIGGWNLFTTPAEGENPPREALNVIDNWGNYRSSQLPERGRVVGMPMSAVRLKRAASAQETDFWVPVKVRRVIPWHNTLRYECELRTQKEEKVLIVCFSERASQLKIGDEGVAVFSKEDIYVFENERGVANGDTAPVD